MDALNVNQLLEQAKAILKNGVLVAEIIVAAAKLEQQGTNSTSTIYIPVIGLQTHLTTKFESSNSFLLNKSSPCVLTP